MGSRIRILGSVAEQDEIVGTSFQTWEGFGSFARSYFIPDFWNVAPGGTGGAGMPIPTLSVAQRNTLADLVFTTTGLGMTRTRWVDPITARVAAGVSLQPMEDPNDNADPYVVNAAGFDYSAIDDIVDWIERGRARDLETFIWSPNFREAWLGPGDAWGHGSSNPAVVASEIAEFAEWFVQGMIAMNTRGILPDVIGTNEPSFLNGANRMSKAHVLALIKELCPRLNALGLLKPWTLGDDNTLVFENALIDTVMADATAASYVGSFSTHLYDQPLSPNLTNLKNRGVTHSKSIWMTEFSWPPINTISDRATFGITDTPLGYAVLMHHLIVDGNMTAIDYMAAIFGQAEGSTLVEVNYSGGAFTGTTIRREGYYFGQFSKFIRPGDRRVAVTSSDAGAKVCMFFRPGKRIIVAINPTGALINTNISSADLASVSSVIPTRSSAAENWAVQAAVPVAGGSFAAALPASSVTTFVGSV